MDTRRSPASSGTATLVCGRRPVGYCRCASRGPSGLGYLCVPAYLTSSVWIISHSTGFVDHAVRVRRSKVKRSLLRITIILSRLADGPTRRLFRLIAGLRSRRCVRVGNYSHHRLRRALRVTQRLAAGLAAPAYTLFTACSRSRSGHFLPAHRSTRYGACS